MRWLVVHRCKTFYTPREKDVNDLSEHMADTYWYLYGQV